MTNSDPLNKNQFITSVRMPKKHKPEIVLNNLGQTMGDDPMIVTSGGNFKVDDSTYGNSRLDPARMDSVYYPGRTMNPNVFEQSLQFGTLKKDWAVITQNQGDDSPGEEISDSESQSTEIGGEKHAKRTPSPLQYGLGNSHSKIFREDA
jgi:hypothetical protein